MPSSSGKASPPLHAATIGWAGEACVHTPSHTLKMKARMRMRTVGLYWRVFIVSNKEKTNILLCPSFIHHSLITEVSGDAAVLI